MDEAFGRPWIVGHRGASFDAPENTAAAFALAWEQGADGIECDVRLTADGEVVVVHDADTGRVGDGGWRTGKGLRVERATWAQLRAVEVGRWKAAGFAGERVPRLSEVLAALPAGKRIFVELKAGGKAGGMERTAALVDAVLAVVGGSGVSAERVTVMSFDAAAVTAAKRQWPGLTVNWLTGFKRLGGLGRRRPGVATVVRTLERCGADGLGGKAVLGHVDAAFVAALRERGYGVHLWTVNDPAIARRAAELGVDSLTTDRPGFLRAALRVGDQASQASELPG